MVFRHEHLDAANRLTTTSRGNTAPPFGKTPHDTIQNSQSVAEIATLNAALAIRIERGEDEKAAHDAINNAWVEDATVADLI